MAPPAHPPAFARARPYTNQHLGARYVLRVASERMDIILILRKRKGFFWLVKAPMVAQR